MLRVIAAAVPSLPQLQLQVNQCVFEDQNLSDLVASHAGHQAPGLAVQHFQLQTDQHAAADWPWQRIQIGGDADAAAMVSRLPLPGPGQATVSAHTLVVNPDVARVSA